MQLNLGIRHDYLRGCHKCNTLAAYKDIVTPLSRHPGHLVDILTRLTESWVSQMSQLSELQNTGLFSPCPQFLDIKGDIILPGNPLSLTVSR